MCLLMQYKVHSNTYELLLPKENVCLCVKLILNPNKALDLTNIKKKKIQGHIKLCHDAISLIQNERISTEQMTWFLQQTNKCHFKKGRRNLLK